MGYNEYKSKHRADVCPVSEKSGKDKRRRENDIMRDFFEDLGKRLGETAETVTNKAGDALEIQRMKSQIRGLARGNAVDLMELGRAVYEKYKAGEDVGESAKALCEAVKDREASIEDYEKKIAELKGSSECAGCGKMVAKDMSYCPYCGEKMEDIKEEAAGEVEETLKKAGDMAKKAAEKTGDMAQKAAEKTGDMAQKAAKKAEEMAEKAADKISDTAEKVSEKMNQK